MTIAISGLVAWMIANPALTVIVCCTTLATALWFVSTYWAWILLFVLVVWVIPAVVETLHKIQDLREKIHRMAQEQLTRWLDAKEKVQESLLMETLKQFKGTILRMGSMYVKKNASTVTHKQETLVDLGNDQGGFDYA